MSNRLPRHAGWFACAAICCLLVAGSGALAGPVTLVRQDRYVHAHGERAYGAPMQENRRSSTDFGRFFEAVEVFHHSGGVIGAYASAAQDSHLTVSDDGAVFGVIAGVDGGSERLGEADSESAFVVEFQVDSPVRYRLSVLSDFEECGEGRCSGSEDTPPRSDVFASLSLTGVESLEILPGQHASEGTLSPETYVLEFRAFADESVLSFGSFELELRLSSAGVAVPLPRGLVQGLSVFAVITLAPVVRHAARRRRESR
jgi:hypothetical protein